MQREGTVNLYPCLSWSNLTGNKKNWRKMKKYILHIYTSSDNYWNGLVIIIIPTNCWHITLQKYTVNLTQYIKHNTAQKKLTSRSPPPPAPLVYMYISMLKLHRRCKLPVKCKNLTTGQCSVVVQANKNTVLNTTLTKMYPVQNK